MADFVRQPTIQEAEEAYDLIMQEIDLLDQHNWSKHLTQKDIDFIVKQRSRLLSLANHLYNIHHRKGS